MIGDFEYIIDDATPRKDVLAWNELVSRSGCSVHFVTKKPHPILHSNWRHFDFGPICINYIRNHRSFCAVDTPNCSQSDKNRKFKLIYTDAAAILRHYDRSTQVPAHVFVLLDSAHGFEFQIDDNHSLGISLNLDPHWLLKYVPNPKLSVADPVSADSGWARLLLQALQTIEEQRDPEHTIPRSLIADQLGSLLSLLFLPAEEAQLNTRHQVSLYSKLNRILHEHFHEPDLTPQNVAQKAGISRRHVFKIFSSAGMTFSQALQEIRLLKASEMLQDDRYNAFRVCDIAWACGFSDQGHFSRKFKSRFSAVPSAYRKTITTREISRGHTLHDRPATGLAANAARCSSR